MRTNVCATGLRLARAPIHNYGYIREPARPVNDSMHVWPPFGRWSFRGGKMTTFHVRALPARKRTVHVV